MALVLIQPLLDRVSARLEEGNALIEFLSMVDDIPICYMVYGM